MTMRCVVFALALCPAAAVAGEFLIPSRATQAVIYPSGGQISHDVRLNVPMGRHQIVLPDLPQGVWLDGLRVSAPDVTLGAVRFRENYVPPRADQDSVALRDAKALVADLNAQIQTKQDQAAAVLFRAQAAQDQITFLTGLGNSATLPTDPTALSALAKMIGTQTLAARQDIQSAQVEERKIARDIDALKDQLKTAQQALKALVPQPADRPYLVVDITAESNLNDAPLQVSFFSNAVSWQPTYDLRLSDTQTPVLNIMRAAHVVQNTSENWTDIELTLSTQTPSGAIDPGRLYPDLKQLMNPELLQRTLAPARKSVQSMGDDMMAEPMLAESALQVETEGLALTYRFSQPVSVASGADVVRIPFDQIDLPATLVARAVPLLEDTGFIVAKVTNTSAEPLLAATDVARYFGGSLVGRAAFPQTPAGGELELGFGTIDGLQLTRAVLDRAEGDRGILTRSNEATETVRIDVSNLTNRAWDVELRDRVPYSEQEDLKITYTARPTPDVRRVKDQRGILQWNFALAPGAETSVATDVTMTWPDGQIVQ
ncbi:MAG: mucoidy inhibitor MuiA family protein [Paracoccaceae bacterium]